MILNAVIEKDENGYFAYIPELKGCVSQGESYEEALLNIKEAGELYLESLEQSEINKILSKTTTIVPIEIANA
ncbi:HicB family protein [Helicobacter monodelphidis]|uniref:Type II toxin-antitoxin system HicB family antitoxin n=1 Tax=Helicobacter didelphidarum TaxID=2040648 RepID=A0A3D8IHF8_9HELI|nr:MULTISPECIES: type II toxin-antitoxin system HicB family antitoxin [Helicobacter]RAX56799.1 HicB family protein [Helicobacter sp. 15-1451]RDU64612.1 type II toxin-antitoxin system HicB family antitoxin [Helicobacter didelphidarum]